MRPARPAPAPARPARPPAVARAGRPPPRAPARRLLRLPAGAGAPPPGAQPETLGALLRGGLPSEEVAALLAAQPGLDAAPAGPESARALASLTALMGVRPARKLLAAQPGLLDAPLEPWIAFLSAYGLSDEALRNLLSQCPQLPQRGTLVAAAAALTHLKRRGLPDEAIIHKVLAAQPQLLMQSPEQIDVLLRLWAKFAEGIDADESY